MLVELNNKKRREKKGKKKRKKEEKEREKERKKKGKDKINAHLSHAFNTDCKAPVRRLQKQLWRRR